MQEQKINRREILKTLVTLSIPTILEEILSTLLQYVDTAMVGHLGEKATASVSVTTTVTWLVNSIPAALGVAVLSMTAKALGSGDREYLQKIAKRLADNFEKKLARTLHEQLNICNVSGLFEILDDSYTLYTWGSKIDKLAKGDFTKAAEQILSLDFDKKTIKDAATQKAVGELKNKADELAKAMLKYVNGTLVTDKNSWLYKIGIHCPVDVAIFDSNGNQIGFVSEEELWYNDGIEITEIGGSKQIVTFTDDELTLKITGTGYGVMNCTFEECDSDGNVKGSLNYYDISV